MTPTVIGGGPAGAAAALAILRSGARPVVYEKSRLPRHKVCGEFLSPEILEVLEELGVAAGFHKLGPARVTHAELHFARRSRRFRLPEPAWGLSRYRLDELLLESAVARGADLRPEPAPAAMVGVVHAAGRASASRRGRRIFGFKAHHRGASNDAVELYFFPGGYCGLCPVEAGVTNVCGLVREDLLAAQRFDVDALLAGAGRLRERLATLDRVTGWFTTGPLRYGRAEPSPGRLLAGDAGCFVDPFTGSGLLSAVRTGAWAGEALLQALDGGRWDRVADGHRRRCATLFRRQLAASAIARALLSLGCADPLASLLPGPVLFRLTRPAT